MTHRNSITHLNPSDSSENIFSPLPSQIGLLTKPILEHSKDLSYINEATNDTVSPNQTAAQSEQLNEDQSQNAVGFDIVQKQSKLSKVQYQDNSNTKPQVLRDEKPAKIQMSFDEAPTNKFSANTFRAIRNQIKKEAAQTGRKICNKKSVNYVQVKQNQAFTVKLAIPYNQATEKIIQGKSLRERFSNLLSNQLKYPIGFNHRTLLKILKNIDVTIQFVTKSKKYRSCFLHHLKTNLRDNLKIEVSRKEIGQLLFIDSGMFKVEWAMNQKIKRYDLLITLPQIASLDQRVAKARKAVVNYLFAKQVEYLAENNQFKTAMDCWSPGFDPNNYQIPEKQLPVHPQVKDVEMRAMEKANVDRVQNNHIKQFLRRKMEESEVKSMCSKDVQKMIFSKKSNAEIEQKLLTSIKERQSRLTKIDVKRVPIDKAMLKMVCQQIMVQYMGRNVSNIPKATLIDVLDKKFPTFKAQSIILCVKTVLQAKQMGFLKEVSTMSKTVICQINKQKFKNMLSYVEKMQID